MAKALLDLLDYVEQAAGGQPDPRLDPTKIVNEAGNYTCSLHEWQWLERPTWDAAFVEDQNWVALPPDFAQLISVEVASTTMTAVTQTTHDVITSYRSSPINDPLNYYVAIEYPAQTDRLSAQPNPRLAIWPTPGTTESGALRVNYRAGWVELTQLAQVANVPPDIEPLLVEVIRAFARAYVRNESTAEAVEGIERSALLDRLKRKYGMVQPSLGQMRGGIVAHGEAGTYRPFRSIVSAG